MAIQIDTIALAHATGEANAAYKGIAGTETECPCCHERYYPKDSPAWQTWRAAYEKQMTIAAECLLDGVAELTFLLVVVGCTSTTLEYYRAKVYRERKSEADRLARMGEAAEQGHAGDRAQG